MESITVGSRGGRGRCSGGGLGVRVEDTAPSNKESRQNEKRFNIVIERSLAPGRSGGAIFNF